MTAESLHNSHHLAKQYAELSGIGKQKYKYEEIWLIFSLSMQLHAQDMHKNIPLHRLQRVNLDWILEQPAN